MTTPTKAISEWEKWMVWVQLLGEKIQAIRDILKMIRWMVSGFIDLVLKFLGKKLASG